MSETVIQRERVNLGPVELLLDGGEVRYVRVGGVEVLRRIYVAVRDASWGTVAGTIWDYRRESRTDGLRATYRCVHRAGAIDFVWAGRIGVCVRAEGDRIQAEVEFAMDGESRTTFMTNRTGICVLHPIRTCAGRSCLIGHPDGSSTQGVFPDLIMPQTLFGDVRKMVYEPTEGLEVEFVFEGEVFETEDQRNWTDGSYKTYCRPLGWGFPYELKAGQRVKQGVKLRIKGHLRQDGPEPNVIHIGNELGPLPPIGLRASSNWQPGDRELALLRALKLSHVRFDARAGQLGDAWAQVGRLAELLGIPVELAIHLPRTERESGSVVSEAGMDLMRFAQGQERAPWVRRVIVYRDGRPFAGADYVRLVERILAPGAGSSKLPPGMQIGGGTIGNFAELNRNRPPQGAMDVLAWPVNPQIHSTDDLSLMENLEAQGTTVRTARSFAAGAHLAVGPIMLHRRLDPFAAGKSGQEEEVFGDPRQKTGLGAAWTLASIKQLSEAGADSLTYYETAGAFGVMEGGEVFPLYGVLKAVGEMRGARVLRCESSDPLAFEALALRRGQRLRVMVACLRDQAVELTVRGTPEGQLVVNLGAYDVLTLDYEGDRRLRWARCT